MCYGMAHTPPSHLNCLWRMALKWTQTMLVSKAKAFILQSMRAIAVQTTAIRFQDSKAFMKSYLPILFPVLHSTVNLQLTRILTNHPLYKASQATFTILLSAVFKKAKYMLLIRVKRRIQESLFAISYENLYLINLINKW